MDTGSWSLVGDTGSPSCFPVSRTSTHEYLSSTEVKVQDYIIMTATRSFSLVNSERVRSTIKSAACAHKNTAWCVAGLEVLKANLPKILSIHASNTYFLKETLL